MTTDVMIDSFAWWHIPAVMDLELHLFPTAPWSEAQFWSELAADGRHMIVALKAGQVVGYAGINLSGDQAEVMTIAVAPPQQGKGLGGALFRDLLDAAERSRVTHILLEVELGNDVAIGMYERFGFARIGIRRDYYGQGIDALLMERHV